MGDILFILVLHLTFICFSSLTRWENNVSCLVSTYTTQILAYNSGETCIFLSHTWFSDNQFRYLWIRTYPVYCSLYTVLSLLLKAFRVLRTDTKSSSYFCSFRFSRNLLLLAVHIQVETILQGIVSSDFTLLSEPVSSFITIEEPILEWKFFWNGIFFTLAGNSGVHFRTLNEI